MFWLRWVFTGVLGLSLVVEHELWAHGLGSGTLQAWLTLGKWDLPGSGIKPMSPALAGGLATTELPGKSHPEAPSAPQHRAWHSINICTYFIVYTNYIFYIYMYYMGFPRTSVGKDSACSAGDLGSTPGL